MIAAWAKAEIPLPISVTCTSFPLYQELPATEENLVRFVIELNLEALGLKL